MRDYPSRYQGSSEQQDDTAMELRERSMADDYVGAEPADEGPDLAVFDRACDAMAEIDRKRARMRRAG